MTEAGRCEATEHNYLPVPRERVDETVSHDGVGMEFKYEPVRIYCTKCGWVRRIDEI